MFKCTECGITCNSVAGLMIAEEGCRIDTDIYPRECPLGVAIYDQLAPLIEPNNMPKSGAVTLP